MSFTFRAFDREWSEYGLQDYHEFVEKIHECNQRELGDCTAGEWFYIPDEPSLQSPTERVIYFGSWGNYNAPGADSYTYAEVYDMSDPDDAAEYDEAVRYWRKQPEWKRRHRPGG